VLYQRTSQTVTKSADHYAPSPVASSAADTANSVTQYTNIAGTNLSYDTNGNLTNDDANTYSDDPLGRHKQKVATGGRSPGRAYNPPAIASVRQSFPEPWSHRVTKEGHGRRSRRTPDTDNRIGCPRILRHGKLHS